MKKKLLKMLQDAEEKLIEIEKKSSGVYGSMNIQYQKGIIEGLQKALEVIESR